MSRLMIGAEPPRLQHVAPTLGAFALEVSALRLPRRDPFGVALEGLSLSVRGGEIVGVAGVSGNGQRELMAALSGEDTRAPPGSIKLFGRCVARTSPWHRRRAGLHFVPEERLSC